MDRNSTNHRAVPFFAKTVATYLFRLFLLDLWKDRATRPILVYAIFIHVAGMLLFNWLESWGYLNSLYFTFTTLATVGYGDFVPTSTVTKLVTIFFSINGIVLLLVLFDLIRRIRAHEIDVLQKMPERLGSGKSGPTIRDAQQGTQAADEVHYGDVTSGMTSHPGRGAPKSQHDSEISRTRSWLFPAIVLWKDKDSRHVLLYAMFNIAVGIIMFHLIEGWKWLDSTYFVIVTLTTIGYGDLVPLTSLGKIITIFYGLNGIVILLGVFDSIRRVRNQQIRMSS